jgi:hypothetical protein
MPVSFHEHNTSNRLTDVPHFNARITFRNGGSMVAHVYHTHQRQTSGTWYRDPKQNSPGNLRIRRMGDLRFAEFENTLHFKFPDPSDKLLDSVFR